LYKNGEELESGIVNANGTVENQIFTATADFGDGTDQLYFITYVDSVFMSATDSFAVFKYTWLIDKDDILIIKNGDEYQGFEVIETSKDGIVLENSKCITLNLDKDKKNYFTDSWYFQTSDKGKGSTSPEGYIIYPATDVVVEDKNATVPIANSTEETNITSESNESENVSADHRTAPSSGTAGMEDKESHPEEAAEGSSTKLPGFGIISGIIGVMMCLALRRKS
ncbi:MAG: S-layer protein domain-containing protein, partial [Sulfurovum sp.]